MIHTDLAELERLEREATPGPWQSLRDGNQYVKTMHLEAELVGASRIEGVLRPWNPHAYVAFGMKAEQHEIVRFKDADADMIAALRNNASALITLARLGMAARDFLEKHGATALGDMADMGDKIGAAALESLLKEASR